MLLHSCDAYHVFISLQSNFEDVSLLCLGQEEEHGLGLMCSRADKNHTPLWVIQVILSGKTVEVIGGQLVLSTLFKALPKPLSPNTKWRESSLRCNRAAVEFTCIYNCHRSASQVILSCTDSAAWSESLKYLQYKSQRRDMNHTHHFRLCPSPPSLPDNTQPLR